MKKQEFVIVSRHAGAVEFIHREMPETKSAPVLASATIADVDEKVVVGNIPLQLAQYAREVIAIEFDGQPPRGAELSLPDMDASGAKLTKYTVIGPADRAAKGVRDTYLVDRDYAYHRPGYKPAGRG